ncbi:MAG: DUF4294 domain-containing protein [Bacteroidia bacterium]
MGIIEKKYNQSAFTQQIVCVLLFLLCFTNEVKAQTDTVRKDTIFVDFERLDPVLVSGSMDSERQKQYRILKRRVRKTMPYAKMASYKIRAMEDQLSTIKGRRARKKYIKKCEKGIKAMYTAQLKNLTIGEGKVLMKLIHRETGKTTWDIMKNYRGTTEALLWQAFGSFWGHNLKLEFDPVSDYQIEHIIEIEGLE